MVWHTQLNGGLAESVGLAGHQYVFSQYFSFSHSGCTLLVVLPTRASSVTPATTTPFYLPSGVKIPAALVDAPFHTGMFMIEY